jgi:hypothetical protein
MSRMIRKSVVLDGVFGISRTILIENCSRSHICSNFDPYE